MSKKVAVIMGSDSDLSVMVEAVEKLKQFRIPYEVRIISAHRTPALAEQFASAAADNGFGVIIAGAGKAAHLGGVLAAYTTLPVIGVPIKTSMMGGQPPVHGPDAQRRPRGHCGGQRRRQRRHPGRPDAGTGGPRPPAGPGRL